MSDNQTTGLETLEQFYHLLIAWHKQTNAVIKNAYLERLKSHPARPSDDALKSFDPNDEKTKELYEAAIAFLKAVDPTAKPDDSKKIETQTGELELPNLLIQWDRAVNANAKSLIRDEIERREDNNQENLDLIAKNSPDHKKAVEAYLRSVREQHATTTFNLDVVDPREKALGNADNIRSLVEQDSETDVSVSDAISDGEEYISDFLLNLARWHKTKKAEIKKHLFDKVANHKHVKVGYLKQISKEHKSYEAAVAFLKEYDAEIVQANQPENAEVSDKDESNESSPSIPLVPNFIDSDGKVVEDRPIAKDADGNEVIPLNTSDLEPYEPKNGEDVFGYVDAEPVEISNAPSWLDLVEAAKKKITLIKVQEKDEWSEEMQENTEKRSEVQQQTVANASSADSNVPVEPAEASAPLVHKRADEPPPLPKLVGADSLQDNKSVAEPIIAQASPKAERTQTTELAPQDDTKKYATVQFHCIYDSKLDDNVRPKLTLEVGVPYSLRIFRDNEIDPELSMLRIFNFQKFTHKILISVNGHLLIEEKNFIEVDGETVLDNYKLSLEHKFDNSGIVDIELLAKEGKVFYFNFDISSNNNLVITRSEKTSESSRSIWIASVKAYKAYLKQQADAREATSKEPSAPAIGKLVTPTAPYVPEVQVPPTMSVAPEASPMPLLPVLLATRDEEQVPPALPATATPPRTAIPTQQLPQAKELESESDPSKLQHVAVEAGKKDTAEALSEVEALAPILRSESSLNDSEPKQEPALQSDARKPVGDTTQALETEFDEEEDEETYDASETNSREQVRFDDPNVEKGLQALEARNSAQSEAEDESDGANIEFRRVRKYVFYALAAVVVAIVGITIAIAFSKQDKESHESVSVAEKTESAPESISQESEKANSPEQKAVSTPTAVNTEARDNIAIPTSNEQKAVSTDTEDRPAFAGQANQEPSESAKVPAEQPAEHSVYQLVETAPKPLAIELAYNQPQSEQPVETDFMPTPVVTITEVDEEHPALTDEQIQRVAEQVRQGLATVDDMNRVEEIVSSVRSELDNIRASSINQLTRVDIEAVVYPLRSQLMAFSEQLSEQHTSLTRYDVAKMLEPIELQLRELESIVEQNSSEKIDTQKLKSEIMIEVLAQLDAYFAQNRIERESVREVKMPQEKIQPKAEPRVVETVVVAEVQKPIKQGLTYEQVRNWSQFRGKSEQYIRESLRVHNSLFGN